MENDEHFYFRWSNYQTTVMDVLNSLLKEETLVDVTLASEGKWLRAHRLVLTAYSDYFKDLLTIQPEKHPILYLKDVPFSHLEALVSFMYRGEVDIPHKELPNFMKTANSLRIKGLSDTHRRRQELAAETIEQPKRDSPIGTNVPLEISPPDRTCNASPADRESNALLSDKMSNASPSETASNTSKESPCVSPTLSLRRSKRLRSESPSDPVPHSVRKIDFHEKRIPVVKLTPIDSLTYMAQNKSAAVSLRRSPRNPSVCCTNTSDTVLFTHSPYSGAPVEASPSSLEEESINVDSPPPEVTLVELGDSEKYPSTLALSICESEEEDWVDVETIEDSTAGAGSREANNNGPTCGEEGRDSNEASENQGVVKREVPVSENKSKNEKWSIILTEARQRHFACLNCRRLYALKSSVVRHSNYECSKGPRFYCSACSYQTKHKFNLKRHFRTRHQAPDY